MGDSDMRDCAVSMLINLRRGGIISSMKVEGVDTLERSTLSRLNRALNWFITVKKEEVVRDKSNSPYENRYERSQLEGVKYIVLSSTDELEKQEVKLNCELEVLELLWSKIHSCSTTKLLRDMYIARRNVMSSGEG
eukprot:GHVL01026419.1.p1 GENE.GHVL01026419.1~~GHVL01026419.1.p1  ORF type:complete len:136 (-),score=17.39 GHVL01026419.1:465-872(-)